MKAILALLILSLPLMGVPRIISSQSEFNPSTHFSIVFDNDMIPQDRIGKNEARLLLQTTPQLEGSYTWKNTRTAVFKLTSPPRMGTTYSLHINPELKDQKGQTLPETTPVVLPTPDFTQIRYFKNGSSRLPKFTLVFNDSIDPNSAAPFFHFRDNSNQIVAAQVRRATWQDHQRSYYLIPTWEELSQDWKKPDTRQLTDDTPLLNCLVVEPISPLPIGNDWSLLTLSGLPNLSKTAQLKEKAHSYIGKISPFIVQSANPIVIPNTPRYLRVTLNQSLPADLTPETLRKSIQITPVVENLSFTIDQRRQNITVTGDFSKHNKWDFSFTKGLISSEGLPLKKDFQKTVTFHRLQPGLSTPSHEQAQLSHGNRSYEISSLNLKSYHLRIKRLNPTQLVRAYQGYRHYTGDGHNNKRIKNRTPIPYELVAGETVFDGTIEIDTPLDTTHTHHIDWNQYLPKDKNSGLFFISATGRLHPSNEFKKTKPKIVQSLIQLTDIGLAWKLTGEKAFIYAYSCQTGKPLPQVTLNVFGEDAKLIHQTMTDEEGIAHLPRGKNVRHLRASLAGDHALIPFDDNLQTISLWRYPVRYSYQKDPAEKRQVLLFTDRNLYRPSETVRLKGLVRHLKKNTLHLPTATNPQLTITDSAGRDIHEQNLTLSDTGSFDLTYTLPANTVGRFHVKLTWPDELEAAAAIDNWHRRNTITRNANFHHAFHVQEFKRNAFEPKATLAAHPHHQNSASPDPQNTTKETLGKLPSLDYKLSASYYQGTAVSQGRIQYYLSATSIGFYPENYRDYYFADHRQHDSHYWHHYYGYQEESHYTNSTSHNESGQARLDTDGKWEHLFHLPSTQFPGPNRVHITSEITDPRNQTLTAKNTLTVHPSAFYLGLSRQDKLHRINEVIPFKIATVKNDGTPYKKTCQVTLTVERQYHTQVKTKAPNGKMIVKNESHTELLHEETISLTSTSELPFTPTKSGKHTFTVSTTDHDDNPVKTAVTRHIYGSDEYPWSYENGQKIKLVAEQKRYQVGDIARILVLSPIEGHALVTVERDGVLSHFITFLKADNPIIEIPVTDDFSPNAFVSVMIIKGAQENLRKNKEPQLRIGYCELTVDPTSSRLHITMDTSSSYTRPGQNITVTGKVTDHLGKPVPHAEITFFAEDEGTLAVIGYTNPNPLTHFYAPRPINTEAGTSLSSFMPETPAERYHANKGFFIGEGKGGFHAEPIYDDLRRNFDPCAAWFPELRTDSGGTFTVNFPAPDTLTRYRLIAIAQHSANRFGTAQAEAIVSKPLMLEPNPPRFANQGDHLQPTALIQNTTTHAGTWKVTLQLGSLTAAGAPGNQNSPRLITQVIDLAANAQALVPFDLHFIDTGEAYWIWHAEPIALHEHTLSESLKRELSDTVISTFNVSYPMPLLNETHFASFRNENQPQNLLSPFSQNLLNGKGHLQLDFSRTRLLEAGGAIDHLLHYPYGCVEQTTSSTIPWIAAKNMRHLSPAFQKKSPATIKKSIQAGAHRLLSMQTTDGGLSYWPGNTQSTSWASSYGGLGLILCRDAGASVPQQSLTNLARYLKNQLKGSSKITKNNDLEILARSLYVLACLDQPEKSYQNNLLARADSLSPNARIFLALALHHSGEADVKTLINLIEAQPKPENQKDYWMPYRPSQAYKLLAYSTIAPASPQCDVILDQLLEARSARGHWRTTWCNAWSLLAMGAYAKEVETLPTDTHLTLTTEEGVEKITLNSDTPASSFVFKLHPSLKLTASSNSKLFLHSKLSAKPLLKPVQAVSNNGLEITRTYERLLPDGSTQPLTNAHTGDLVKVTLDIHLPEKNMRYLAIDDPLPSTFEAINSDFSSQAGHLKTQNRWEISNTEIRSDRVLFFIDRIRKSGSYQLTYHARITTAGKAYAPPAKIEEMYSPENYALSSGGLIHSQPTH